MLTLFRGETSCGVVADILASRHYLGEARRGWAWSDERGVMVFSAPTARRLPTVWLELTRWCLYGEKNAGSRQWSEVRDHIIATRPDVTTVVSYSDPGHGHTGSLYRACNWVWAPTWHRLRPPPSGHGSWVKGKQESVKDRWVAPLRRDSGRESKLAVRDASLVRKYPWAEYREPKFRRGIAVQGSGGGDFRRWKSLGGTR